MATQNKTGETPALAELLSARRAMGGGLLWAAVMLLILAFWLGARDTDLGGLLWGVALLLALGALAGAAWQFVSLRTADTSSPGATATLLKQRKRLAYALFGGSAVLLLLACWLAAQHGVASFPEVSSMVVLALIGAGAGVSQLLRPGGFTQERLLQAMVRGRPRVMLGLFVAAAASLAVAIWQVIASGLCPEVVGFAVLALLFVGAALWQSTKPQESATGENMRLLVLFTGGAGGLIVAIMIVWRTYLSWSLIFPSNVAVGQSEGIWRLWLYVYIEMFALAILFGSLLLARVDIRQNAFMRRLLFGYNAVLTGLLVLATLVLLNVVVYATYPLNFEFSKSQGLHGLADSTKNLLRGLKEDVHVYVLLPTRTVIYSDVRNLMDNLQAYTRRLQVTYLSPDRDAESYRRLIMKYPEVVREREMFGREEGTIGRGILLVYGPDVGAKSPHAFVPMKDLYELKSENPRDPRSKEKLLITAEPVLMTQLRLLANQEVKPRVYFTQSNGELDLENSSMRIVMRADLRGNVWRDIRGGAGLLLERLKKDNYEVRGLLWGPPPAKRSPLGDLMVYTQKKAGTPHEIPADAEVIIIAHPQEPFNKDQLAELDRYMERGGKDKKGGKLILLANALPTSGDQFLDLKLAGFLKKYGVQLKQDYLICSPKRQDRSPLELVATPPEASRSKVAAAFQNSQFVLGLGSLGKTVGLARSVDTGMPSGTYDVDVLLEVGEKLNGPVWGETNVHALNNPVQYIFNLEAQGLIESKQSRKPVPVAVAVKDRDGRPRLAVFGDARFASNFFVRAQEPYYDFLTSTVEWLAERPENLGIKPKESGMFHLDAEKVDRKRLIWMPLALILLTLLGMGLGMWVVRRR